MLVLSRRAGEEVVIGDLIRLTVVEIRGRQVRLGFTAPRDINIRREELCYESEEAEALAGGRQRWSQKLE
jgi:carbon storage regulator